MSEAKAHRVILVIDRYWPEPGGAQVVARTLCEQLKGQGLDFIVLTRHFREGLSSTEIVGDLRIKRFGKGRSRLISKIRFLLSTLSYLIRHRREYDLVHVHLCVYETDLLPVFIASLITRKPYVIHFHGMLTVEWMMKRTDGHEILRDFRPIKTPVWVSRAALRSARAIITLDIRSL